MTGAAPTAAPALRAPAPQPSLLVRTTVTGRCLDVSRRPDRARVVHDDDANSRRGGKRLDRRTEQIAAAPRDEDDVNVRLSHRLVRR